MAERIDWVPVERFGKPIGAVGFIGDTATVIVAFYDDFDPNKDGKVGWGEWVVGHMSPVSLKGNAVAEVAMQARNDVAISGRDPSFPQMAANVFVSFAASMVKDAIYTVYFSSAVSSVCGSIAGRLASNVVASYAIRKGMEKAVKAAYDAGMK